MVWVPGSGWFQMNPPYTSLRYLPSIYSAYLLSEFTSVTSNRISIAFAFVKTWPFVIDVKFILETFRGRKYTGSDSVVAPESSTNPTCTLVEPLVALMSFQR